jgi:hypothetical protein
MPGIQPGISRTQSEIKGGDWSNRARNRGPALVCKPNYLRLCCIPCVAIQMKPWQWSPPFLVRPLYIRSAKTMCPASCIWRHWINEQRTRSFTIGRCGLLGESHVFGDWSPEIPPTVYEKPAGGSELSNVQCRPTHAPSCQFLGQIGLARQ